MAMFNGYVKLPEGYTHKNRVILGLVWYGLFTTLTWSFNGDEL